MASVRKTLLIIASLLIVSTIGVFVYSGMQQKETGENTLTPKEVTAIPYNNNAFFNFSEADELFINLSDSERSKLDDMSSRTIKTDKEFILPLVSKNKNAFSALKQGIYKNQYQYLYKNQFSSRHPAKLINHIRMAQIELLHAEILTKEQNTELALNKIIDMFNFGNLLEKGGETIELKIVGFSIKNLSLVQLNYYLNSTSLDRSRIISLIKMLEKIKTDSSSITEFLKNDYQYFKTTALPEVDKSFKEMNVVTALIPVSQGLPFIYDKRKTLSEAKSHYSLEIKNAQSKSYDAIIPHDTNKIESYKNPPDILSYNGFGKIALGFLSDHTFLTKTVMHIQNTQINLMQTKLALIAYHQDNQNHPESLKKLTPEYLDKTLLDLKDGKTLRYDKKNRILYSEFYKDPKLAENQRKALQLNF